MTGVEERDERKGRNEALKEEIRTIEGIQWVGAKEASSRESGISCVKVLLKKKLILQGHKRDA